MKTLIVEGVQVKACGLARKLVQWRRDRALWLEKHGPADRHLHPRHKRRL